MPVEEATRVMSDVDTLASEDALRAQMYRFLARLLSAPADGALLKSVSEMEGDETGLGKAMLSFAKMAQKVDLIQAEEEYHDLFIGVARG